MPAKKITNLSIGRETNEQAERAQKPCSAGDGEVLIWRVVRETDSVVVVCSEKEFQAAASEGREPSGIGFPKYDVVAGHQWDRF